MLRITIDLIPYGDERQRRTLTTMDIWNDVTGDADTGNYQCRIDEPERLTMAAHTTEVQGFPRRRLGSWDLVYRALRNLVGSRNEPRGST